MDATNLQNQRRNVNLPKHEQLCCLLKPDICRAVNSQASGKKEGLDSEWWCIISIKDGIVRSFGRNSMSRRETEETNDDK